MPTKSEVLQRFQRDLGELNARFEAELATVGEARLEQFRSLAASRSLVATADAKEATAQAERLADRARASAGREQAVAAATQKRWSALDAARQAWRKAEERLERSSADARTEEERRHADEIAKVDAILPMYKQFPLRGAEDARHEQALERIREDYAEACARAREDYQTANEAALADELRAAELANDAEQAGLAAADAECVQTLENVRAALSDGLLKLPETRGLEEGFQEQMRLSRGRWVSEKEALRARFKADYESAEAG